MYKPLLHFSKLKKNPKVHKEVLVADTGGESGVLEY
jgi:hypothetical protein